MDLMGILRESSSRHSIKPLRVIDPVNASEVTWRFAEALNRSGMQTASELGFKDFVASAEAERFFDQVKEARSADTTNPFRPLNDRWR